GVRHQPSDGRSAVVGSCRRPSRARSVTTGVLEAGVDTWRLLFCSSRAHRPGPVQLDTHKPHRVPARALLAGEGHPTPGSLCPAHRLEEAYARVTQLLDAEVDGYEFRGIARLDSTATTVFARGQEGIAFLQGVAALDWPRLKPEVIGKPPETVYLI